jgi:hypothetical protein
MPRNGAGSYSPPANTWNPATAETPILSTDWNATLADLSLAITQSMATDGQSTFSARIPFAQGASVSTGSVSAPSLAFIGDTDTGWYSPAPGQIAVAANGVQALLITSTGVTFPFPVTFTGNQSVSGTFTVAGLSTLNGSVVLGDAVGDTITVNGTTTFVGPITVPDASFTNAKLANVPTATFKGRTTAGTGVPEDLTVTQATALLNAVVGDSGAGGTKGLVPAPAAGDAADDKFLSADGTWAVPPNPLKAYGVFTGTTGATVAASGISLSRVSAGVYDATLSPALASVNYAVFVGALSAAINPAAQWSGNVQNGTKTTSTFRVNVNVDSGTPALSDPDQLYIQVLL